ncbi:hypothetical protein Tco_1234523 [Tanacetum coccineum]
MRDENQPRTLADYSRPSHEGYRNTIKILKEANVSHLQSETIWLVQNACAFHGRWSDNPKKHLKDFPKIIDSIDLIGASREMTRMRLFQFYLRNQDSNWLDYLPTGSISTWDDLTSCLFAQCFSPGRTTKLHNDNMVNLSTKRGLVSRTYSKSPSSRH